MQSSGYETKMLTKDNHADIRQEYAKYNHQIRQNTNEMYTTNIEIPNARYQTQSQMEFHPPGMKDYDYRFHPSGQGREHLGQMTTLPPGSVHFPMAEQGIHPPPHQEAVNVGQPRKDYTDKNDDDLLKQLKSYNNWKYYLNTPSLWTFEETDEYGLHVGTKTIMLETTPIFPKWVKEDSQSNFKKP